jgi:hypothetical protein
MSEPKTGFGFLAVPLAFVAVVIAIAIADAGGLNQFLDGLGLVKGKR